MDTSIRTQEFTESLSNLSQNTLDFIYEMLFTDKKPTEEDKLISDIAISYNLDRNAAAIRVEAQKRGLKPFIKYLHIYEVKDNKVIAYDFEHYAFISDKIICSKYVAKRDGSRENGEIVAIDSTIWNGMQLNEDCKYFENLNAAFEEVGLTI